MSLSSKKIDAVVSGELGRWLRAQGFRKDGRTFRRWDGSVCLIVNVQASHGNTWEEARFYVNLAAYHTKNPPVPDRPKEYEAQSRRRLEPQGHGWWTLTPDTDCSAVSTEVAALLETEGLPWLQRESTLLAGYARLGEAQSAGREIDPPETADGLTD